MPSVIIRKSIRAIYLLVFLSAGSVALSSFYNAVSQPPYRFPYQQAGLSAPEAAAHLISRFSFGATPGQVDEVANMGLEKWFAAQLEGGSEDEALEARLAGYESLRMSNSEIVQTYPKGSQVLRMAIRDGVIEKDAVAKEKNAYKKEVTQYMQEKGLQTQAGLLRQLMAQKILRAAYSNNQLQEVLTDFWFNHFNVAVSKGGVPQFITSYERDVIRPNVLGSFEALLLATAKSPAMLIYLDNTKSAVNKAATTPMQQKLREKRDARLKNGMQNAAGRLKTPAMQGLNENYAREIMELHTLGVDGGYTQTDVTEAARVFTGWSVNPQLEYNLKAKAQPVEERAKKLGFVYDENFLFAAHKHDQGAKIVLGQAFPAGGDYEEGVALVHLLATHPSTATAISKKLAMRFVSDAPPQALIDKMAQTFSRTHGDIKAVLIAMVSAPEFWSKSALHEKMKSPFELAISAVRSTNAQIAAPYSLYQWITRMGQKLYNYQAPTGFPERSSYWINTGSLLNRMNFGLAFASGRIPGIVINLLALNNNHEPESAQSALRIYAKLLLPERNEEQTIKRLTPMLADPELGKKVDNAAGKITTNAVPEELMNGEKKEKDNPEGRISEKTNRTDDTNLPQATTDTNYMLAQVVGIIIGSPEFQRR